jgi:hypothetical protein
MALTPTQILADVESVGSFVAGFFPGAAPAVTITESVIPLIAPGLLSVYQAVFGAKPATISDAQWLVMLQDPAQTQTALQYIQNAQATLKL